MKYTFQAILLCIVLTETKAISCFNIERVHPQNPKRVDEFCPSDQIAKRKPAHHKWRVIRHLARRVHRMQLSKEQHSNIFDIGQSAQTRQIC